MSDALMIEALEALHSPSRIDGYMFPRCDGCDMDGFEAESPAWPCRTAAILWPDPDEQAAVLADWHEWADPKAAETRAKYSGAPFVAPLWEAQIAHSLAATSVYLRPGENHNGAV